MMKRWYAIRALSTSAALAVMLLSADTSFAWESKGIFRLDSNNVGASAGADLYDDPPLSDSQSNSGATATAAAAGVANATSAITALSQVNIGTSGSTTMGGTANAQTEAVPCTTGQGGAGAGAYGLSFRIGDVSDPVEPVIIFGTVEFEGSATSYCGEAYSYMTYAGPGAILGAEMSSDVWHVSGEYVQDGVTIGVDEWGFGSLSRVYVFSYEGYVGDNVALGYGANTIVHANGVAEAHVNFDFGAATLD